jgi:putative endonuclease
LHADSPSPPQHDRPPQRDRPPQADRAPPADRPPQADRPRQADRRRSLGRLGEDLAATHFERLDFRVLARNVRTRHGEIDLIAFDGHTIVFVEVKTRRVSAQAGDIRPDQEPLGWLRAGQLARLRRLAAAWLRDPEQARPTAHTIRFDAVGVIVDGAGRMRRLDHIEQAW